MNDTVSFGYTDVSPDDGVCLTAPEHGKPGTQTPPDRPKK